MVFQVFLSLSLAILFSFWFGWKELWNLTVRVWFNSRQVLKSPRTSSSSIPTGEVLAHIASGLLSIWKVFFFKFFLFALWIYWVLNIKHFNFQFYFAGLSYEYVPVNLVKGEQFNPGEKCLLLVYLIMNSIRNTVSFFFY